MLAPLTHIRPITALAAVVSALVFVACGGDESTAPEPGTGGGEIVVLLPDSRSSERWERDDRRFLAAALEATGLEYSIVNAEGDAVQMEIQAQQAIAGGAEVLVMAHLGPGSAATIIENARARGVAVIDYDRLTTGAVTADFYVGADPRRVGRLLGRGLADAVSEAGLIAPGVAVLADPAARAGSRSLASGYAPVIERGVGEDAWAPVELPPVADRVAAERALTRLLDSGAAVDAVVATDDALADAAIDTLGERGPGASAVVGRGATVTGLQNMLAGDQTLSVYVPIPAQARAAIDLAAAIVAGEPTDAFAPEQLDAGSAAVPALLLEPITVTGENIAETVIEDGLRSWPEICVAEFEPLCPPPAER